MGKGDLKVVMSPASVRRFFGWVFRAHSACPGEICGHVLLFMEKVSFSAAEGVSIN